MTLIIATGASGVEHKLWAHPIGTEFTEARGYYIICSQDLNGDWIPHYAGQASGRQGLNGRVGTCIRSHEHFEAAVARGATHVAVAAIDCDDAYLCWIENDLIQALNPPLNRIAPPGYRYG